MAVDDGGRPATGSGGGGCCRPCVVNVESVCGVVVVDVNVNVNGG